MATLVVQYERLSKRSTGYYVLLKWSLAFLPIAITGCSSLLPNAQIEVRTPWHNYAEAHAMFEKVIPSRTTLSELKALGVDPDLTPNISVLAQTDLLRRLIPIPASDIRFVDPQLRECISPQQVCFAYEIEQTRNDRERSGNFWLDVMDFKRVTEISGWKFNAVFVVKNDVVIHKLWTGTPNIRQHEEEFRPLGPIQGLGTSLLGR